MPYLGGLLPAAPFQLLDVKLKVHELLARGLLDGVKDHRLVFLGVEVPLLVCKLELPLLDIVLKDRASILQEAELRARQVKELHAPKVCDLSQ